MRAVVIVLILLIVPSGAWAQWAGDPDPPKRYLYKYNGILKIWWVESDEVWSMCDVLFSQYPHIGGASSLHSPEDQLGCSVRLPSPLGPKFGTCRIVVGKGDMQTYWHEVAHCNGWLPSHPRF
jgi:hypothetical protein